MMDGGGVAPRLDTAELKIQGSLVVGIIVYSVEVGTDRSVGSVVRKIVDEVERAGGGQGGERSVVGSRIAFQVLAISNVMGAEEFGIGQNWTSVEAVGARAHEAIRAIILGRVGLNAMDGSTVLVVEGQVGCIRGDLDGVKTSSESGEGGDTSNGLVHRMRALGEHGTFVQCGVDVIRADVMDRGGR
jgi:hypothetical protein